MANHTQVAVIGNVTREPELRTTAAGKPVLGFSIAVNEGDKTNPRTSFYDVSAWDTLALNGMDTLVKGMRVVVMGILQQQNWETPRGEKRSKVQIVAEGIGPDLRFCAIKVFPNTRPDDGRAKIGYPEGDEPWDKLQRTFQTPEGSAEQPNTNPF